MKRGVLLVVSGPSGAGKGTICKALLEKHKEIYLSVSATTRAPRKGEVDGVNYYFTTKEEFVKRVEEGDFLEHAEVYGNYYGTPKSSVEKMLEQGKDVILPPSMEELKQRIIKRGSETPESLMTRFKSAYKEINYISKYNYAVVNDEVDLAVKKLEAIITAEKCRVDRMKHHNILDSKEGFIHEQLYD